MTIETWLGDNCGAVDIEILYPDIFSHHILYFWAHCHGHFRCCARLPCVHGFNNFAEKSSHLHGSNCRFHFFDRLHTPLNLFAELLFGDAFGALRHTDLSNGVCFSDCWIHVFKFVTDPLTRMMTHSFSQRYAARASKFKPTRHNSVYQA